MPDSHEDIHRLLSAAGFFCIPVSCIKHPVRPHPVGLVCVKKSSVIFFRIDHAKDAKTRLRNKSVIEWVRNGGDAFIISSLDDAVKALRSLGLDEPVTMTSGWKS